MCRLIYGHSWGNKKPAYQRRQIFTDYILYWLHQLLNNILYAIPVGTSIPPKWLIDSKISVQHKKKQFFGFPFCDMVFLRNLGYALWLLNLKQLIQDIVWKAFIHKKCFVFGVAGCTLTCRKECIGVRWDMNKVRGWSTGSIFWLELSKSKGIIQQFI